MEFNKTAIVGAGLIGCGWTTHLLVKGVENIAVYDIDESRINNAKQILSNNLAFLKNEGIITQNQFREYRDKPIFTTIMNQAVQEADLVIENGPEILDIKREIISKIEEACLKETIISTSTSGISINSIVLFSEYPDRIIGAHPYHPVYLLPLVEIIANNKTSIRTIDRFNNFMKQIDKKPVFLKKESPGYIASRLMQAILRESLNLIINNVCTMQDIEDAFTYGPGLRYSLIGPFTTLQLAGGDRGLHNLLTGPIGKEAEKWMSSYANWASWPPEVLRYFENCQTEMDEVLISRDLRHGRNNEDISKFRDKGLLSLLRAHDLI
jgi:carnitine 3-dehydrogenase